MSKDFFSKGISLMFSRSKKKFFFKKTGPYWTEREEFHSTDYLQVKDRSHVCLWQTCTVYVQGIFFKRDKSDVFAFQKKFKKMNRSTSVTILKTYTSCSVTIFKNIYVIFSYNFTTLHTYRAKMSHNFCDVTKYTIHSFW